MNPPLSDRWLNQGGKIDVLIEYLLFYLFLCPSSVVGVRLSAFLPESSKSVVLVVQDIYIYIYIYIFNNLGCSGQFAHSLINSEVITGE